MAFDSKYVWFEGKVVPFEEARVHVLTSSLHYGTAIFEGIRSYSTPDGPAVFRLKDHVNRFFKSAKILGFKELPYSEELIYESTLELVEKNEFEECYIRPVMYIKEGGWNLTVDNVKVDMSIAVWKWANYLGAEALNNGVRANVSSYPRHHPNITMTKGKIAGNYVNSVLAKTESVRGGFDEAIMLDHKGNVSECTGENLFVVRNNQIITPPRYSILEGITRDSLIKVANEKGYLVTEAEISRDQLYVADEVFVCGTAAEVIALSEIDNRKIGSGSMGPVCADLQKEYSNVIHGKNDRYKYWLDYVNKPSLRKAL